MNYENMSDFEINKSVSGHLGVFWHVKPCNSETGGWVYSENYEKCDTSIGQVAIELPDYCNNPSDAWPIIVENDITLFSPDYNKGDNDWRAEIYDSDEGIFDFTCVNPLRAAMIVFLMVQEAKRG